MTLNPAGVTRPVPPLTTAGRIEALKTRQPVRFFLWPAVVVLVVVLAVDFPGSLIDAAARSAALVLLLAAIEAARATAWTLPRIIAEFRAGVDARG
jgi:hypothetical protein